MKKLTTFFLIFLFALTLQGQKVLTYDGKVLTNDGKILIQNYVPESKIIFAAMGTTPDSDRKRLIDNFVRDLIDDGIWAKLDFLYILAAHAENSSLLNWINPGTFDATNVHVTAYEVDRGYTGDGANDYLNSNYNPNTDAINYLQDDASMGVYVRTDVAENNCDIGGYSTIPTISAQIFSRLAADGISTRINDAADLTPVNTDSRGFFIVTRTRANARRIYKNKISIGNDTQVSVGRPNIDIFILARNSNGSDGNHSIKQVSAAFAGSGMTQINVNNFHDRLETYLDALGAGVVEEALWLMLLLIPNILIKRRKKEYEFQMAA